MSWFSSLVYFYLYDFSLPVGSPPIFPASMNSCGQHVLCGKVSTLYDGLQVSPLPWWTSPASRHPRLIHFLLHGWVADALGLQTAFALSTLHIPFPLGRMEPHPSWLLFLQSSARLNVPSWKLCSPEFLRLLKQMPSWRGLLEWEPMARNRVTCKVEAEIEATGKNPLGDASSLDLNLPCPRTEAGRRSWPLPS